MIEIPRFTERGKNVLKEHKNKKTIRKKKEVLQFIGEQIITNSYYKVSYLTLHLIQRKRHNQKKKREEEEEEEEKRTVGMIENTSYGAS